VPPWATRQTSEDAPAKAYHASVELKHPSNQSLAENPSVHGFAAIYRLRKFTNAIFENDTEGHWHPKVRELLVMTLLLRYDQFINILNSHPFTKLVETDADADERYS
jgi:hypothetical protein